jgi:hypothetical protein
VYILIGRALGSRGSKSSISREYVLKKRNAMCSTVAAVHLNRHGD